MKLLFLLIFTALSSFCLAQSAIELEFKTGNDDLANRDFQEDLEIRIAVKNKPSILFENANRGGTWARNSTQKIRIPIKDNTITAADFKTVTLTRRVIYGSSALYRENRADNWDLKQLIVRVDIVKGNNTLKYTLLDEKGDNGKTLFRFTYTMGDQKMKDGVEEGFQKAFTINNPVLVSGTSAKPTVMLKAIFKTGGDDLRGGNDNVSMRFKFKNGTDFWLRNLNDGKNWQNFSTTTVEQTLAPEFNISDIENVELRHRGGGGIGADNWYLDELKIIIKVNNIEYVILDRVGTPIHYFKGDSRSKIFKEELTIPIKPESLK
jgi:hypothetical protein